MNFKNKPIVWLSGEIKTPPFSKQARIEAGFLLRKLQQGESLSLPYSRPMPNIGNNCHELRINDEDKTWRIIYYLGEDAIVILDVFSKKDKKTPKDTVKNSKKRLKKYFSVFQSNNSLLLSIEIGYGLKIPIWIHQLLNNEEMLCHLVDLRISWYAGKNINLYTHLKVYLKTLYFVFIEYLYHSIVFKIRFKLMEFLGYSQDDRIINKE